MAFWLKSFIFAIQKVFGCEKKEKKIRKGTTSESKRNSKCAGKSRTMCECVVKNEHSIKSCSFCICRVSLFLLLIHFSLFTISHIGLRNFFFFFLLKCNRKQSATNSNPYRSTFKIILVSSCGFYNTKTAVTGVEKMTEFYK